MSDERETSNTSPSPRSPGQFAYEGLERVIHEKARLSILASLSAHRDGVSFNDLKELCRLTDGNLSRQLQVLREEGFVEVIKDVKGNRPLTIARLTPGGRERFLGYIDVLQRVVADAAAAGAADDEPSVRPRRGGLSTA
jgi:DNA-binding HxlR family transcriptional regulator